MRVFSRSWLSHRRDSEVLNMTESSLIRHNVWRLAFVQVVPASLGFAVPYLVIFWQEQGLAFHQIMTLQAIYAVVNVLAEVPSGYIADRLGRGRSISLGLFLAAVGSFFYTLQPCYAHFVLTEVFLALGFACISGADTAPVSYTHLTLPTKA